MGIFDFFKKKKTVYTYEPDEGRGVFSIHLIELQKFERDLKTGEYIGDAVKVAEGWSLMLRSIRGGNFEIEDESIFLLPDKRLRIEGVDKAYYHKVIENSTWTEKLPEYDDILIIDEKSYEEYDIYMEAYDVYVKNVKEWIDDLDGLMIYSPN
jgi:hypothetical protein